MNKREALKKDFYESLGPLIGDKEAQDDKEILDFYMEVCCTIAEDYAEEKFRELFQLESELTQMFDSDVRVALALLEEIRKLKSRNYSGELGSKERYLKILNEIWKKYGESHWTEPEDESSPLISKQLCSLKPMEHSKESFLEKIRTDKEFSKKWNLVIFERNLTKEERYNIWFLNNYETGMEKNFDENTLPNFDDPYYVATPTKVVYVTYGLETFKFHE